MSASVTYTEFDQLESELLEELLEDRPDFEKVQHIISSNKDLLNKPITLGGKYVLHLACEKHAPYNIVIEFINGNPLAVQQNDYQGCYPLHYACEYNQSESVIKLLVKEYPLAVQQKESNGLYPLVLAIKDSQNENVVLKLIELFPEATASQVYYWDDYYDHRDQDAGYPLHLACWNDQSERVLLVLIHLSLHAVKHRNYWNKTPLCIAKENNQSSTIIKVLEELTTMSDYDLENRIGIPTIVALHGLDNLRRNDIFQWVMHNSPIQIDGKYIFRLSKKRKASSIT